MASNKVKKIEVPDDPCPDCGVAMQEIVLSNLFWAAHPASFWSSAWKRVRGRICPTEIESDTVGAAFAICEDDCAAQAVVQCPEKADTYQLGRYLRSG